MTTTRLDDVVARRPATEDDVPFLMALRHRTMDGHLLAAGTSLSEEEHLQRVRYRFDCAEILLADGKPCGLFKVARDDRRWVLIQIQVAPELQGRGIGARLIRKLVDEARRAGASLELDVLKANPARRLYERLGFVVVSADEHSYDMRLDAAIPDLPRHYVRNEIERRWLVDADTARSLAHDAASRTIDDLFIEGTHLRLRKVTGSDGKIVYKLGKKYGRASGLAEPMTTIYLSAGEYAALSALPGRRFSKRRYAVAGGSLDVPADPERSPRFEVEFDTEDAARSYVPPAFVGVEEK